MDFPSSADEFYKLRDNRTDLYGNIGDGYQKAKVLVICSPKAINTYSGQVMVLTATNMLSRFCRNATIVIPGNVQLNEKLRDGYSKVAEQVFSAMNEADPFGNFTIVEDVSEIMDMNANCVMLIGSPYEDLTIAPDITVDGTGWIACVGRGARNFGLVYGYELNPVGTAIAAAIGLCEVFKTVTGQPAGRFIEETCFSAYDLKMTNSAQELTNPEVPAHMDIGSCLMIGVGMVGSSFLYLLKKTGLLGKITLVDADLVKVVNMNRSPIFGKKQVGNLKVNTAEEYMKGSDFQLDRVPEIFNLGSCQSYDIVLPLANEFGIRNKLQSLMPPLAIHVAVSKVWGITYYRHIPIVDPCLNCYPLEERPAQLLCSTTEVEYDNKRVDAALPFLPILAGAVLVSELLKLQMDYQQPVSNVAEISLMGNGVYAHQFKKPVTNNYCLCRQNPMIHEKMICGRKYASVVPLVRSG